MTEHEMSRTLVKSLPELWAECSDTESLARHLGRFGEIRITRVEPETAVAWEGDRVSGTVRLKPSNWGTHVTLTARPAGEDVEPEPIGEVSEKTGPVPVTPSRVRLAPAPEPEAHAKPPVRPEPEAHAQPPVRPETEAHVQPLVPRAPEAPAKPPVPPVPEVPPESPLEPPARSTPADHAPDEEQHRTPVEEQHHLRRRLRVSRVLARMRAFFAPEPVWGSRRRAVPARPERESGPWPEPVATKAYPPPETHEPLAGGDSLAQPEPRAEPGAPTQESELVAQPESSADPQRQPVEPELPAPSEPLAEPEPPAQPPVPASQRDAHAALRAALDSLGQAHHRPFSRG